MFVSYRALSQPFGTYHHVTYPGCTIPYHRPTPNGKPPSWEPIRGYVTQHRAIPRHTDYNPNYP